MSDERRETRWTSEASFFDREAETSLARIAPVSPETRRRYEVLRRRRFSKEFRFSLLGNLRGKRVLDVGSGDGINSVTLALLGAEVVGLDISPKAIEVATERARINRVEHRTTFVCAPLECAEFAPSSFDIIWGDAILHHVLADLDRVLGSLSFWSAPTALVVFAEPINLSPLLRRFRLMLPVPTHATPDERPLEASELVLLQGWMPDLRIRHFGLLERLNRFVLTNHTLETSGRIRRFVGEGLALADVGLLALPPLRRFAGKAVLYGHIRRAIRGDITATSASDLRQNLDRLDPSMAEQGGAASSLTA